MNLDEAMENENFIANTRRAAAARAKVNDVYAALVKLDQPAANKILHVTGYAQGTGKLAGYEGWCNDAFVDEFIKLASLTCNTLQLVLDERLGIQEQERRRLDKLPVYFRKVYEAMAAAAAHNDDVDIRLATEDGPPRIWLVKNKNLATVAVNSVNDEVDIALHFIIKDNGDLYGQARIHAVVAATLDAGAEK